MSQQPAAARSSQGPGTDTRCPRQAWRADWHPPATGAPQHTARPVKDHSSNHGAQRPARGGGARCPPAARRPTPALRPAHACAARPRHAPCTRPRSASTAACLGRHPALARGQTAGAVLLVRAARLCLDAEALRQYIPNVYKEGEKTAEDQRRVRQAIRRASGGGVGARRISRTGRAQRRRCLPLCPWGADRCRQGAASVRARCRADGGQNVAWQLSGSWGQSSGDAGSAAALTSPRAAALTGVPW
jgi:hypothetical protein